MKIEHSKHYAARMLRLLGRLRDHQELHPDDGDRLASWMHKMRSENTVVVYLPETEEGFHYMRKPVGFEENDGIPIYPEEVRLADIGERVRWE